MSAFILLGIFLVLVLLFPRSGTAREGVRFFGKKALKKAAIYGGAAIIAIALFAYDLYQDPYLSFGGPFGSGDDGGSYYDGDEEENEAVAVEDAAGDVLYMADDSFASGKIDYAVRNGLYSGKGEDGFSVLEVEFVGEEYGIRINTADSSGLAGELQEVNDHVAAYSFSDGTAMTIDFSSVKGTVNDILLAEYGGRQFRLMAGVGEEPVVVQENVYYRGSQIVAYKVLDGDDDDSHHVVEVPVDFYSEPTVVYGYADEDDEFFTPVPDAAIRQKTYAESTADGLSVDLYLRKHNQYGDRFAMNLAAEPGKAARYAELVEKKGTAATYYDAGNERIIFVDFAKVNGTAEDSISVTYEGKEHILYPENEEY